MTPEQEAAFRIAKALESIQALIVIQNRILSSMVPQPYRDIEKID